MTALSNDRKTDKIGVEEIPEPVLLQFPVEAATSIYGGAIVCINAAGNAVPASANSALKAVGRCEKQALNLATGGSPGATGSAGSITVLVRQGLYTFNINADSSITAASFGANVYASDDNTISLSDAGGTRPYVGFILAAPGTMGLAATVCGVMVGFPNPYSANPLAGLSTQYKARAVVTTLQAYTGSGTNTLTETVNGAISAADGVTLAVGDVVIIPAGTTNLTGALDAGPWQVSALGSGAAKWVLVRPDWWTTGAVIPLGQVIDCGGEGTLYGGTQWKSFAAQGSAVIGTNDPVLWPDAVTTTATLVAGSVAVTSIPVRSLTKSQFQASLNTIGGTLTGTVGYGVLPNVSALTAGNLGTVSITFKALASADAVQASDTSTINVTITNW